MITYDDGLICDSAYEALRVWMDRDQADGWDDDEFVVDIADTDGFWVGHESGGTQFSYHIHAPDYALPGPTWLRAWLVWYGDYPVDPGWLAFQVKWKIVGSALPLPNHRHRA